MMEPMEQNILLSISPLCFVSSGMVWLELTGFGVDLVEN